MDTTRATKRVEIDAGHRLLRHGGKCAFLHGHRYAFEATVAGIPDAVGVVCDFAEIRRAILAVVEPFDHATILEEGDPLIAPLLALEQRVVVVRVPPSAERLAELVYERLFPSAQALGCRLRRVRCYETPSGWADYAP